MKKLTALAIAASLLAGCAAVETGSVPQLTAPTRYAACETVSGTQLMELTGYWKDTDSAVWYYMGSDTGHHYFLFHGLGAEKTYRTPRPDVSLESIHPLTEDKRVWRVMPWGPRALIEP